MINCKHCNTENLDESVYCKQCGKRLDGMKPCPKCEKMVPDDALFCNYCGARVEAASEPLPQQVKPQAATAKQAKSKPNARVVELAPESAPVTDKKPQVTAYATAGEITAENVGWRKIIATIGTGFALLTSVISLIFVFLIGFGVSGSSGFEYIWQQMGMSEVGNISIYDYFGKNYEEIQVILDNNRFSDSGLILYVNHLKASLYITAILGTVISAVTLLGVTALSIASIVKTAQKLAGKDVKHAEALSVATFITYVIGMCALLTLNFVSASATAPNQYGALQTEKFALSFNGASVAGLVLGAVFCFISVACKVAAEWRAASLSKRIINLSMTAVGIALMTVTMNYAYNPTYMLKMQESYQSAKVGMPVSLWAQAWGMQLGATCDKVDGTFMMLVVTQFLQIALTVLAGITIALFIKNLFTDRNSPSCLALTIATLAVAVVYLVMGQIAMNKIAADGSPSIEGVLSTTYAIVSLVFAALSLVLVIVKTVLNKSAVNAAVAEQPAENAEQTITATENADAE